MIALPGSSRRPKLVAGTLLAVLGLIAAIRLAGMSRPDPDPSASIIEALSEADLANGFRQVTAPRQLSFPSDHGPHPGYRTEWWYYTGNLAVPAGEQGAGTEFGYQLTFFRNSIAADPRPRSSAWATTDVYMAHFAVTDVAARDFYAFERMSRGAAGLAGARAQPYGVWLENWSAAETGEGTVRLRATSEPIALTLALRPLKEPALHGDDGFSQKGPEPGNASHYYSLSRLATTGLITVAQRAYVVDGLSWMDHEWSTSALSREQVGWDWFSLQLDDGRELMLFHIRRGAAAPSAASASLEETSLEETSLEETSLEETSLEEASLEETSSGSLIHSDGRVTPLSLEDFTIDVLGTWTSPSSGAVYPSGWRITVPRGGVRVDLRPKVDDQELDLRYRYWEGAVRFGGTSTGSGYVELTGY